MASVIDPDITEAQLAYGAKVVAVEPGGVEVIPPAERHGRPIQLLWTWASPNMEFATSPWGSSSVLAFGLTFWQAVAAIVLGTAAGLGLARGAVDLGPARRAVPDGAEPDGASASAATSCPPGSTP